MIKYEDDDYELEDTYEDAWIFKKAVPSQYYSVLYNRLVKDNRLDDFLKVLKLCSLSGKTLKETCTQLGILFKGYVRDIGVTPDMLNKMRNRYSDVSRAMSFDRECALLDAFENGAMIAAVTDKMKDVVDFVNTFDKHGMFTGTNKETECKGSKLEVKVTNEQSEPQYNQATLNTQQYILDSIAALKAKEQTEQSEQSEAGDE